MNRKTKSLEEFSPIHCKKRKTSTRIRNKSATKRRRQDVVSTNSMPGSFKKEVEWIDEGPTILDLPPELLLHIFSWMSISELCQSVAHVCSQWSILAKDPCLWRELSFLDNRIPLEKLRLLLRNAPLLRKLTLVGRSDCNSILREVSRSNRRLETLVMKRCTGAKTRQEIGGKVLIGILKQCSKLSNLTVKDTQFRSLAFYQLLGKLCNRFNHVKLLNARKEEIVCFLQACLSSPVTSSNTKGILNGQPQELEDMIHMFADDNVDLCGGLVIVDCWKVRGVLRKHEGTSQKFDPTLL